MVHRRIAGDVPIYQRFALKVTGDRIKRFCCAPESSLVVPLPGRPIHQISRCFFLHRRPAWRSETLILCRPSLFVLTLSVGYILCMLSYSIYWSQSSNKLTLLYCHVYLWPVWTVKNFMEIGPYVFEKSGRQTHTHTHTHTLTDRRGSFRSSAIADGPRNAIISWNLVNCCIAV